MIETLKPTFNSCKNCIVFCSDNGFMPATSVAIQSILENGIPDKCYDIIILHSNITEFTQKTILDMYSCFENLSVRFMNVEKLIKNISLYTANRKNFTKEAYYRLLIPWVLDEAYEKAFYIDGDMIARKDLSPIFDIDIQNYYIAAIRDYWGICNCYIPSDGKREYRISIGLENIDDYIISGTLLFNLELFRKSFSLEKVISLCAQKNWVQHDQDVINILCKNRIKHIPADWGWVCDYGNNHYLPQPLFDELGKVIDPVLIHYAAGRKPWISYYTPYHMDFWKYAEHTPYFSFLLNKIENMEAKNYIAYHLSNGQLEKHFDTNKMTRQYKGVSLGSLDSCHTLYHCIKIVDNTLHLEGLVGLWGVSDNAEFKLFIRLNELVYPVDKQYRSDGLNKDKTIITYRGEMFEIDLPLDLNTDRYIVTILCEIDGYTIEKKNLGFGKFAPLSRSFSNCYYCNDNWIVKTDKKQLFVIPASESNKKQCEEAFCAELQASKSKYNQKAAKVRKVVPLLKRIKRKPIWLISDRLLKSDDNGEIFFKFLIKNKSNEIDAYFLLGKDSADYQRLSKIGKVIEPYSRKHKLLQLLADFSISTQTDAFTRNPFGKNDTPYKDLLSNVKFIFLQHGVICTDLSTWLCKKNQYMSGFVTSTYKEYTSILNGDYHYDESTVWLTGLPRFDALEENKSKVITILPTWRKYLSTGQNQKTGIWNLIANFSNSAYASFYRELLHNERLQCAAKKYGYTIQFKIHPTFLGHEDKFGFDENVQIVDPSLSYRDLYAQSNLLVTDYSSSIYDFIYMYKPIIYAQFDHEEFFSGNHTSKKGDFDYEKEGFGEVEYTLDSTIDRIIEYMENDCQLKDIYRERIDNCFAFNDQNCCERVYNKIIECQNMR